MCCDAAAAAAAAGTHKLYLICLNADDIVTGNSRLCLLQILSSQTLQFRAQGQMEGSRWAFLGQGLDQGTSMSACGMLLSRQARQLRCPLKPASFLPGS